MRTVFTLELWAAGRTGLLVGQLTASRPRRFDRLGANPRPSAAEREDAVENFLNREVCRGAMPLAEAQRQIATDWLSVFKSRGLTPAQ